MENGTILQLFKSTRVESLEVFSRCSLKVTLERSDRNSFSWSSSYVGGLTHLTPEFTRNQILRDQSGSASANFKTSWHRKNHVSHDSGGSKQRKSLCHSHFDASIAHSWDPGLKSQRRHELNAFSLVDLLVRGQDVIPAWGIVAWQSKNGGVDLGRGLKVWNSSHGGGEIWMLARGWGASWCVVPCYMYLCF